MNAHAIEPIEPTIEPSPAYSQAMTTTPAQMLAIAVNQGADLAKLEKLMELQERWEANEARKAYNAAVAEFKRNPPDIIKDKKNKQYDSMYATLANLVNNGSAALAPYGLTVDWKIDQQDNKIKVTCILKHALGHSEQVSISGLPDESGAKNKLQQIKSTITYLKGETFQCVTGITARDCPGDNDGNGSGKPQQNRSSNRAEPSAEDKDRERRAVHDEAYARHSESVEFIKERIAAGDWHAVANEWRAIPQADQMALWLAPSKGGCLTTAERQGIKDNLPKENAK